MAPARQRPMAADLPRPLGAVSDTVVDLFEFEVESTLDLSELELLAAWRSAHASRKVRTALA
eukprot:CAMPEP_0171444230 /NCGR_PEP_ID=MMETSP0881-20121228/32938_1 /TAXON_ID=67004 /ORGANISM="Thalassiosira weissflogii, Strain CCMP1336" /LENGTH=61 /DNA_ID=CAMNT_0011967889 /DNA_START=1 /DNA_END=186 /DNA_ORIENTATION=+